MMIHKNIAQFPDLLPHGSQNRVGVYIYVWEKIAYHDFPEIIIDFLEIT